MNLGLENRTAFVSASSDGIGKGIAKILSAEGAKVVVSGRDEEKLKKAASEVKAVDSMVCDLNSAESVEKLIHAFQSKYGAPDILVINNSKPPMGKFSELKEADWQKGFEILWAPTLKFVFWALPEMKKKKWGRIILSTSLAAREPIPTMLISSAMRAGMSNFVRGLAREVAPDGITVNAVLPGWTDTQAVRKLDAKILEKVLSEIPARRLGEPKEIGNLVSFLSSSESGYITGQSIAVDGGILHGF